MKLFSYFLQVLPVIAQNVMLGYQTDEHNCILDGGYQWCDSLDKCIRTWETKCPEVKIDQLPIPSEPFNSIPSNCASWYDGCNTCMVNTDGSLGGCTRMMCFTENKPICKSYHNSN